jgi:pyruvate ferredoxin oxidoreductase gamma subunit
MKHVGRPVPNAALLGGFAAVTHMLAFESVAKAIKKKFPGAIGDANIDAAREAYESVREN